MGGTGGKKQGLLRRAQAISQLRARLMIPWSPLTYPPRIIEHVSSYENIILLFMGKLRAWLYYTQMIYGFYFARYLSPPISARYPPLPLSYFPWAKHELQRRNAVQIIAIRKTTNVRCNTPLVQVPENGFS